MSDIFKISCAIARRAKLEFDLMSDLMHDRRDKILGSPEHERSRMEDDE